MDSKKDKITMNSRHLLSKIQNLRQELENLYSEYYKLDKQDVKNYKQASKILNEKKKLNERGIQVSKHIAQTVIALNYQKQENNLSPEERRGVAKIASLWGEDVRFD